MSREPGHAPMTRFCIFCLTLVDFGLLVEYISRSLSAVGFPYKIITSFYFYFTKCTPLRYCGDCKHDVQQRGEDKKLYQLKEYEHE